MNRDKVFMWFEFLIKNNPTAWQHQYCMEFEEGYKEAFEAIEAFGED